MSGPPPSVGASPRRWAWLVVTGVALFALTAAAIIFFALRRQHKPELTGVMPHDLDLYAEVPDVAAFIQGAASMRYLDVSKIEVDAMVEEGALELATTLELPPAEVRAVFEGVDALAAAVRVGRNHHEHLFVARIPEAATAQKILASKRFVEQGHLDHGRRFAIETKLPLVEDPAGIVTPSRLWFDLLFDRPRYEVAAWFEKPRLLVFGTSDLIEDLDQVIDGSAPSLEENEAFTATLQSLPRNFAAFGFFDVRAVRRHPGGRDAADRVFANPQPFVAALSFVESGSRVTVRTPLSGKLLPDPRLDADPARLTLYERVPVETLGYLAISTKFGMSGKDFEAALLEPYEKADPTLARQVQRAMNEVEREIGIKLRDLIDAVGDEAIIATMTAPAWRATAGPSFPSELGLAYLQKIRNEDEARRIVRKLRRHDLDEDTRFELSEDKDGNGFTADPIDATRDPYVKVRFESGVLFASFGPRTSVERFYRSFHSGETTLDNDAAHADAMRTLGDGLRLYGWVDSARIFEELLKADPALAGELRDYGMPPEALVTTGPARFTSAMGLAWGADGTIWQPRIELHNVLPPIPALIYYDLRHQRRNLRVKEAENALRAIATSAKTAYETRERLRLVPAEEEGEEARYITERTLCASADPVPRDIPKRRAFVPSSDEGKDYQTGDTTSGWICLGYENNGLQYFRLSYRVGSGYLGPARGGPDPGPNGFEVSAEGDLDGDGTTSLFTLIGTVDPASGRLDLAPGIFSVDETE